MYLNNNRTTNLSNLWTTQKSVSSARDNYNTLVLKISSGKNYLTRSENTAATNEAANLAISATKDSQFLKNLSTSETWEKVTDSSLQTLLTTMRSANSLFAQANNGINRTESGAQSLASELNGYLESAYQVANAKYLGINLFGGTSGTTNSILLDAVRNADGNITDVQNNTGSATFERRSISTAEGIEISYGTVAYGNGTNSLFATSYTGDDGTEYNFDLFETMVDFRTYLEGDIDSIRAKYREGDIERDANGDPVLDPDGNEIPIDPTDEQVLTRIGKRIQKLMDNVIQKSVDGAASQNRLNALGETVNASVKSANSSKDGILKIDMAKAATELTTAEATLEASLQMAGRLSSMSILDFL